MLQKTVAVNGTVRMVPLGISNAIDLATCSKSSDLRLDYVLGCLTAFTLTSVAVSGGCIRLSVMSSRSSQGTTRLRRRCLRMPREIVDAFTAGMVVPAHSLRVGGV